MGSPREQAEAEKGPDQFAVPDHVRAGRYDRLLPLLDEWAIEDEAAERDRRETLAALDADQRAVGMMTLVADGG